jgi:probable F420-dependent oxidoreductase
VSRPVRFGVAAHAVADAAAWRALARRVEDLGYATLLLPDHTNPQLAPVPGLVAAAAATTTLRVGTQVLCNDLRNPVVTAKEVATLDLLSEGRTDWGMGAGWLTTDYEASGVPFDPPGVRLRRLRESVTLMRALFAGEPVDHDGEFYRAHGLRGSPQPVQRPHPPLLVGGSRERLLRWAGAEADIVSFSPSWDARQIGPYPPTITVEEGMDRQAAWVAEGVARSGRAADDVELSLTAMPVIVTGDLADGHAKAGAAHRISPDEAARAPYVLVGPVEHIADTIRARHERWGLSNWVIPVGAVDAFAPVVQRVLAEG